MAKQIIHDVLAHFRDDVIHQSDFGDKLRGHIYDSRNRPCNHHRLCL